MRHLKDKVFPAHITLEFQTKTNGNPLKIQLTHQKGHDSLVI